MKRPENPYKKLYRLLKTFKKTLAHDVRLANARAFEVLYMLIRTNDYEKEDGSNS